VRVRVQLDFTIEGDWTAMPGELGDFTRIGDFIEGGLEAVGIVGDGKECALLGGHRMKTSVVGYQRKGGAR